MLFIGESINGTRKSIRNAIASGDETFIVKLAEDQINAGSNMLDVNAGTGQGRDEKKDLVWLTELIQKNFDIPLCLDSSDSAAIDKALDVCKGVPMINSISGEKQKLEALLPVIKSRECKVVALCIGDDGIPKTAAERLEIARYVVDQLEQAEVKREDIYIDPIVLSIATDSHAALVTLETMSLVKEELGVNTILAVSNVGFGLPMRTLINRTFIAFAVERGLDALLADIRDKSMIATVKAALALQNKDPFCGGYLKAYRKDQLG